MSTMNYVCPACGAPLAYSGASGKLECESCGSSFELSDLEAMNAAPEGEKIDFETSAETLGSDDGLSAYVCKNCGAELMCEETTTASVCPYCGSPTILPGHIEGGVKPEKVVPFVVTKEKATQMFNEYFKGKKLMPNIFLNSRNRITEMRKLYTPYWLFDCDAYADITYDAEKVRTERRGDLEITHTDHFMVHRSGTVAFDSIPVDGSEKLDDKIAESVEPFDLSKAVPFQSAVLAGAMADHADREAGSCEKRAVERVKVSTSDAIRGTVSGYNSVSERKKYIESRNGKATPVLMPIWMITTDKEENGKKKTYTFAINGQTGKLTCDVPPDLGKSWGWFGISFAIVMVIAMIVLAVTESMQSGPILISALIAAIAGFIYVSILRGQLKTAVMQSGAAQYMRSGSLKLDVKRDRFLYRTTTERKIETTPKK